MGNLCKSKGPFTLAIIADFLLVVHDVNEWIGYECSDEGAYTGRSYFADLRMTFLKTFLQD
jgi:hypothetical protein